MVEAEEASVVLLSLPLVRVVRVVAAQVQVVLPYPQRVLQILEAVAVAVVTKRVETQVLLAVQVS